MARIEIDGVGLFYESYGAGPLTVLVPAACWLESDLGFLADSYRVVFYDQRNRGRSGRSDDISIRREVEDLEEVRCGLELGAVVTLGWSYMGAVVALHAARYPAAVKGVVMVAPMAPRQGVPEYHVSDEVIDAYQERWAPVARKLAAIDEALALPDAEEELWRERQRANTAFRMGDPAAIDRMRSEPWRFENERPPLLDTVFERLFAGLEDRDWRVGMEQVAAPVLIFHGLADGPAAMSVDWQRAFPDARALFWAGVGHLPFLERPGDFRAAALEFLAGVVNSAG